MVKRSSKSKSKRTSIRKKHKIAQKVKAHHRKQRREERLKAKQRKALGTTPSLKDPGVPASWPFREDFIKEMAFEKDRILAEKNQKKAQEKNKAHGTQASPREEVSERDMSAGKDEEMAIDDMEALAEAVQKRAADHETVSEIQEEEKTAAIPDVGGREHYRDFRKVVSLADVVLQVLDARDPNGCRSSEVEAFVHQFTPPKRLVFILNKIDLVPRDVVESWLKVLRQSAPTIAFKCSTQRQNANLGQSRNRTMESKSSVCLGADNLIQLLKNYTRHANIRSAITVGLVGVPNVGKSSVINSLKRSKATLVGNRPGVTKAIQEVQLDSQIRLLDSPGVIYERKHGTLQGVVSTEAIADPIGLVEAICNEVELSTLKSVYGIEDFDNAPSFLQCIAAKMGKLKKGGIPDTEAAARIVVQDWNNGKIPFYKTPPVQQTASDVQVVQNWAAEFSLEGVNDPIVDDSIEELPHTPASSGSPPSSTVIPGALEAFSRMAEVHKMKEQINETERAITDMRLSNAPPTDPSPAASDTQGDLHVRVLHAKGHNKYKFLSNVPLLAGEQPCISSLSRLPADSNTFLSGRSLTRSSHSHATRPRRSALLVEAYKKKGQRLLRRSLDNAMTRRQNTQPNVPDLPVDPKNEEFVIFVRSQALPRWVPYTVMKGGWSANALAKAQGTKWGKNLYGETLIKNIGQAFYKDIRKVEASVRQNIRTLKHAKVLEFGFKIRDKEKPDEWYVAEDVQLLPPKEEVESGGIIDNVKDFFSGKRKLF